MLPTYPAFLVLNLKVNSTNEKVIYLTFSKRDLHNNNISPIIIMDIFILTTQSDGKWPAGIIKDSLVPRHCFEIDGIID